MQATALGGEVRPPCLEHLPCRASRSGAPRGAGIWHSPRLVTSRAPRKSSAGHGDLVHCWISKGEIKRLVTLFTFRIRETPRHRVIKAPVTTAPEAPWMSLTAQPGTRRGGGHSHNAWGTEPRAVDPRRTGYQEPWDHSLPSTCTSFTNPSGALGTRQRQGL